VAKEMDVALLPAIQRSTFVLLVDVGQHHPLGMPSQHLLQWTRLQLPRNAPILQVEDVDAVCVAAGSHVPAVVTQRHSLVGTVALAVKDPLTDDVRNVMHLQLRILRDSDELFVVGSEGNVSDAGAVGYQGVADGFVGVSFEERDGSVGASA
jgi:hypothetical protein